jgi:hypothetical protein
MSYSGCQLGLTVSYWFLPRELRRHAGSLGDLHLLVSALQEHISNITFMNSNNVALAHHHRQDTPGGWEFKVFVLYYTSFDEVFAAA